MKKKEKKEKTDLEKMEHIVDCLKNRVVQKGFSNFVDSVSIKEDDIDFVKCTFQRDGYSVEVKFCALLSSIDIETGFLYPNCDTLFDLDDVLNVLDINDFNEYLIDADLEDEKSQEKAVEDLLYLLEKFDYDIKKAGDSAYFGDMLTMHNEDKALYENNKIKLKTLIKFAAAEHKMQKTKSEKDKQAYIKYAKKQEEAVGLVHKTKRYIKYLEAGYAIPDNQDDSEDVIKNTKTTLAVYVICAIIGLLIVLLIFAIDRISFSKSGTILSNDLFVNVLSAGIGGGALGYLLSRIFGTKLTIALTPEAEREYALEQRKKRFDDLGFFDKLFQRYVAPVFSVVVFAFCILLMCSCVYVTPTQVIDHSLISNDKYDYEDTTVYLLKGYTDDDNNKYYKYDYNCYAFAVKDDDYVIETGEIKKKQQQKALDEIFKEHNIKPIEIDDVEIIQE